jgi:hypothetical protein
MRLAGSLIRRQRNRAGAPVQARRLVSMAEIIQFHPKSDTGEEDEAIDLYTAVDAAIRDLRDITARWGEEAARLQAEECRRMLERAFDAAY